MKFKELINEQFLLYTWNNLKFNLGYTRIFEPISKLWFKKCAFLMLKSSFCYEKVITKTRGNIISIKLLKYKIIESAILNIIQLRLEIYSGLEKSKSIEYVCKLLKNEFFILFH